MEEQKKEEIKELLKKSATTDHFKEHREQRHTTSKPNTDKKEEQIKQERPKSSKNTSSNNSTILISLIIAIVLLLAAIFLIYKQNNSIKVLQSDIKKLKEVEVNTKEVLEPIIKEKKVIEEKEIIKEVKVVDSQLTKEKFKEFYNSRKFNKLTCYDYNIGGIQPTKKCISNLENFLKDNSNAIRIEIIPVISKEDKAIFEGIDKIDLENYSTEKRLKKYALRGLSRDRVLELTWKIKQMDNKDIVLTPTNYFVESQKNNRGVIIKAYY